MWDGVTIARALHVFGEVLWIGGVGFVTTVLLPSDRRMKDPAERVAFFEAVEGRFAWQVRFTTLLVGATGFYMVDAWELWDRFAQPVFWWMHAMVAIWVVFTVMLFVAEPLFLHRSFLARARMKPIETFRLIERMHWFLLAVSLMTVLGAVAGIHAG